MDTKLLERVRDKLKHELSSEEQEALRQCSSTVYTHTRVGAAIGGAVPIYGLYRAKIWPLSKHKFRAAFFTLGGIILGMQLGLVSGSIRCVSIVKALPNPDHVMKALREVQVELHDARRRPLSGGREWTQKQDPSLLQGNGGSGSGMAFGQSTSTERDEQQSSVSDWDAPVYDDDRNTNAVYNGPGPAATPDAQKRGESVGRNEQTRNIWQQIRGENAGRPETAWDRLRNTGSSATSDAQGRANQEEDVFAINSATSADAQTATAAATPQKSSSYADKKVAARDTQQEEFDRLLEKERKGDLEESGQARSKFW